MTPAEANQRMQAHFRTHPGCASRGRADMCPEGDRLYADYLAALREEGAAQLRANLGIRESGDSVPADGVDWAQKAREILDAPFADSPVLNKSGGSPAHAMGVNKGGGGSVLPPCPHSGVIIQVPQLGDGRLTGRYDRTCADCGAVIDRGAAAR